MWNILAARIQQKHRTMAYPDGPPPALPERFAGRPIIRGDLCPADCRRCVERCSTRCLSREDSLRLDLGACLFCRECAEACPQGALTFSADYQLAAGSRTALLIEPDSAPSFKAFDEKVKKLFGRSLKLRQVSAGGCNACEADTNVLGTVGWDLGRFGIQFVASPRHADGLLITGPVPENMRLALLKTYEAVPSPKIVIAVGACAIAGGPYRDHQEVHNGADSLLPVDLFIPGCPPHPLTILDGLLRFIGRIDDLRGRA